MSYDVVINYNSTDYNFMLAQERDTSGFPRGNKKYRVKDQPLMPETLVTGTSSPSTLSPDREVQIIQNDWRKGFQDLYYDDVRKYQNSVFCDARYKGKVMLSPKKGDALTLPSYTTSSITDGGLENWTGDAIDDWTEAGDVDNDQTNEHGGSNCAKATGGVSGSTGSIYQSLSWSNDYRGDVFVCQAYIMVDNAHDDNWGRLTLTDGVNTYQSDKVYATSWTPVVVGMLIDSSADQIKITLDYEIEYGDTVYIDDITKLAQDAGSCASIKSFGDAIVVASNKSLYEISSGSLVWLATFPAAITDLCVYDSRLFIAQGWSANYWYTSDLNAFSYCTLANSTAKYMANVGGDQFWISDTSDTVTDSDDPIVGGTAFSTPTYTVGSEDYDITGLVDNAEGTVYVRKQNMVYYLGDSGVDYELIPELSSASTDIDYPLYMWKGCLYIPSGDNSLFEYDNGTVTIISPVTYASGDGSYDGAVYSVCGDDSYFYAAVDDGVNMQILAGRWETVASDTDWYWHPIQTLSSNQVNQMLISAKDVDKKMYLVADSGLEWVSPTSNSDPDSEWTSESSAYDGSISTAASCSGGDDGYLELNIASISCSRVRVYAQAVVPVKDPDINIDVYYSAAWHNIHSGTVAQSTWEEVEIGSTQDVTAARIKSNEGTAQIDILEFEFQSITDVGIHPFWVSPSYSDPTTETNFSVEPSGTFDTPFFTSTFPKDTKYWRSVDLTYKAVTNTGIQIYKSTDGSSFTSIGNVNTNSSINTDTFDINSASTKMMLRFALTTSQENVTPIIYGLGGMGYGIKARVFGAQQRQIEAVLRIAAGVRQRSTNTKTSKTVSTELTNLRTLYQADDKMTITGPDSTTYNVIFARGGYEEQMVFDESGKLEEWEVTVRFLEI